MTDLKQVFTLRPGDQQVEANLFAFLAGRDRAVTWRVTIDVSKGNKSDAQNRLQWMWHTEAAKHHGETKEHMYNLFKYKHVLPIMLRDDEEGQLTALWENIRGNREAVAALVKVIHTSDLTTAQMAEALTEYDQTQARQGCVFTDPADLRYEAIG